MSSVSSEIDRFFRDGFSEVEAAMVAAGESAVEYNVVNGDYHNVTWRLRRSNFYKIESHEGIPDALVIGNSAPYASDVEARGRMVTSGGVLLAEKMLSER